MARASTSRSRFNVSPVVQRVSDSPDHLRWCLRGSRIALDPRGARRSRRAVDLARELCPTVGLDVIAAGVPLLGLPTSAGSLKSWSTTTTAASSFRRGDAEDLASVARAPRPRARDSVAESEPGWAFRRASRRRRRGWRRLTKVGAASGRGGGLPPRAVMRFEEHRTSCCQARAASSGRGLRRRTLPPRPRLCTATIHIGQRR